MSQQLDWKAEYAYTTGMQAFIYGFPYVYNAKLRHNWVTQARDPAVIPYAAVNHFWHAARVLDATCRDGVLRAGPASSPGREASMRQAVSGGDLGRPGAWGRQRNLRRRLPVDKS